MLDEMCHPPSRLPFWYMPNEQQPIGVFYIEVEGYPGRIRISGVQYEPIEDEL
jgi:hypothetical protein